jgi:hypothetical protein
VELCGLEGANAKKEKPMRFLCLAFATWIAATPAVAAEATAPEILAACEKKFPADDKQQLDCVKEQVDALNKPKKPANRQIVVKPRAGASEEETETELAVEDDAPDVSEPETATEDFCSEQNGASGSDAWKRCMAEEAKAQAAIPDALANLNSDIAGDAYKTCLNFTLAYQPPAHGAQLSHVLMLNCLQAKAPTRAFSICYENFVGERFSREIKTVSSRHAQDVARCFNAEIARK